MTTPDRPEESPALTGLTELYRDSIEPASAAELDRGLDAFFMRVGSRKTRRRTTVRWSMVGAAAALCMVALLEVRPFLRKDNASLSTLAYTMNGGVVVEGGYLREVGHNGMALLFNEGSQLTLTSGTRGRLSSVQKDGAHIAIEHGTAALQITPSETRRWFVDAGPFLVTVKGTRFTVSWDPLSEQFELVLERGRVVVTGPVSAGEIALREGQHLSVNLAKAETVIREDQLAESEPQAVAPAAAPDVRPAAAEKSVVSSVPAAATAPAKNDRHWSDELARGHWDLILDDARRVGVSSVLHTASAEDLFALADAARYRRQPDLARSALLAERKRFPSSPRALDTLFLLGRAEELRERGAKQAIAWYDEYLTKAPSGPLVGEALGRKMTLTDKTEGAVKARPLAAEYLHRFPDGSYAGLARELLRAP